MQHVISTKGIALSAFYLREIGINLFECKDDACISILFDQLLLEIRNCKLIVSATRKSRDIKIPLCLPAPAWEC